MIKKAVQVEDKVIAYDEIDREIFSVEGTLVRYTEFNLQVRKDNRIFVYDETGKFLSKYITF